MILNILTLVSSTPDIFILIINMSSNKKFLEEWKKRIIYWRTSETIGSSNFKVSEGKTCSYSNSSSKIMNKRFKERRLSKQNNRRIIICNSKNTST